MVLAEVAKNDGQQQMFRSMGRMFVLQSKDELSQDLNADMARITTEQERSTGMKNILDSKRDQLVKQLNDLSPNQ